jgi:DNA-binding LacI/PurR family transcriptional regulator
MRSRGGAAAGRARRAVRNKPTLVSLARDVGVSRQTVSNVLNNPERVKPATRERVLRAIEESGYRPSAAARQLRTRRSMDLGMRLHSARDGISGSVLDSFLHALTEAAQDAGYRLTLYSAGNDDEEVARIDELLHAADLDGFVLTGSHDADRRVGWLQERGVPFACFGRPRGVGLDPFAADYPWVDVDGAAGTAEATRFLLDSGHATVGFLGWAADDGPGEDRRNGWLRAMEGRLPAGRLEELQASADDTVPGGAVGARLLLERGADALVCASDSLALGAFAYLRTALPSRPPAVVGFDDTPVAAAVGLSSLTQPITAAARHIIAILSHRLAGGAEGQGPERHLLLEPSLAVRTPYSLG